MSRSERLTKPPQTIEVVWEGVIDELRERNAWTRGQALTVIAAGMLISAILFCGLTVAFGQALGQPSPTATPIPLVVRSASEALAYLKAVDVTISGERTIPAPNATWAALHQISFKATIGDKSGSFVLLSYGSIDAAGVDSFRASSVLALKDWRIVQRANVILAASPGTDSALTEALAERLLAYLVTPYRNFLNTPTPTLQ